MKRLRGTKFGNARDVKAFLSVVKQNLINRLAEIEREPTEDDYRIIKPEDIPNKMEE